MDFFGMVYLLSIHVNLTLSYLDPSCMGLEDDGSQGHGPLDW